MDKEKILAKFRKENFDEAKENYSTRGVQTGFSFLSLLFVLFYVSCAIKGKENIPIFSLLAMYMVFTSSIGYMLYKFNCKKIYLFQFLLAGIISIILSVSTLYWIWFK